MADVCPGCGGIVIQRGGKGRPRTFCEPSCQQRHNNTVGRRNRRRREASRVA